MLQNFNERVVRIIFDELHNKFRISNSRTVYCSVLRIHVRAPNNTALQYTKSPFNSVGKMHTLLFTLRVASLKVPQSLRIYFKHVLSSKWSPNVDLPWYVEIGKQSEAYFSGFTKRFNEILVAPLRTKILRIWLGKTLNV